MHKILLLIAIIVFVWSAINPKEYFTWALEVFPAVIGIIILLSLYNKFRFTDIVYLLILIDILILFIGGHYTYAQMPLFNWLKEIFHTSRNHYDRVGHFMQGLMPSLLVKEILIRKNIIKSSIWLSFIVVCVCLTISVVYEFFEWWVAVFTGTAADSFLGT